MDGTHIINLNQEFKVGKEIKEKTISQTARSLELRLTDMSHDTPVRSTLPMINTVPFRTRHNTTNRRNAKPV